MNISKMFALSGRNATEKHLQGCCGLYLVILLMIFLLVVPALAGEQPAMQMETITVTAEKRETNLQETPISITALTSQQIEDARVMETQDVVQMVPNLFMVKAGNHYYGSFLSLRGITSWMGGEPTVGFYVDDIYYRGFDTELLDVGRIEVLRGPQGTLYGRNTEAGVINIISQSPGANEWQGKASVNVGNYNTQEYKGFISGPVMDDRLSFRVAAKQTFSDGYFSNTYLNDDSADELDDFSGRASVLWTPDADWDIQFNADAMRFRDGYASFNTLEQVHQNPHDVSVDYNGYANYDADGYNLKIRHRGTFCNVTSITAYKTESDNEGNDLDFSPWDVMRLAFATDSDQFSQELRIASPEKESPLRWTGGLFYFNEKTENFVDMAMRQPTPLGPGLPDMPPYSFLIDSDTDTQGFAAFGQASYRFFEKCRLTLGLRWDMEEKDHKVKQYSVPDLSMFGMVPASEKADNRWDEWLPKVSVDYTFRPGLMAYATVSRGYKSGGYNDFAPAGYKSFDPEYTTNYEIGLKSSWLDDCLQANLTLFHIDWTDQQIEQQTYPEAITKNAGESTSQGFELELAARPAQGLVFTAGLGYVHAVFDDYTDNIIDPQGAVVGTVDYTDNEIPNVPEYTYNLAVQYRHINGLFLRAALNGVGSFYFDTANTKKQDAYLTANAMIGWEWERFQIYAWGKNLFDEDYVTRAFEFGGDWVGRAGDPATFGITIQYRF